MSTRFSAIRRLLAVTVTTAALSGCNSDPSGAAAGSRRGASDASAAPLAVPVAIAYAHRDSIASYYSATATLEVERQAEIPARVTGVVQSIAVEEGDQVQSAANLLGISNDQYRFRVEQTSAAAKDLASQVERLERIEKDLVSAEEIATARKNLATARAEEGLATLSLSYTKVTAPFSGRVVRRYVDVGQTVDVNTPLFALADFDPLLARIHVPAKEFRNIESQQAVELVLDSTGQRLQGRITLVSPIIDPTTGTIKVTVEVPEYPDDTRPGDFAEVLIMTEQRNDTVIVPQGAVFTDKGEQVVYVAAGVRAERRVVEVGFTDDIHMEILAGVEPDEAVVIKGQRSLKHGTPLKIIEGARAERSPAAQESPLERTPSHLGDVKKKAANDAHRPIKST